MAEERVERKLTAILVADVAGYSRLMGDDEVGTRARFNAHLNELIEPAIANRRGRIVKTTGDGLLVEFTSVVDAVQCAVEIQKGMAERNANEPNDRRIEFRIGVNLGDVIIEDDDIHGDGVNVAARLEGVAEPGGICISGTVHESVRNKLDVVFVDLGEQSVKNIANPLRVFRADLDEVRRKTDASAEADAIFRRPAVAVLPFKNLSGDPDQEYFADGLTEDIITALSLWRSFPVIARNSSFAYKGQSPDIRLVGKELGARYVVEGSVRKSGNRVRITAQLIDALTGNHVWAERYDRELDDIFAVQDEITEAITGAVGPSFVAAESRRASRKQTKDLDCWDLSMRASWHAARLSRQEFLEAQRLFTLALERDPENSFAWSGLAIVHMQHAAGGWADDPALSHRKAIEAAQRAVAANDQDAYAYAALAWVRHFAKDNQAAMSACRNALRLNPNLASAEGFAGLIQSHLGNRAQALEHVDRAFRLSPLDPASAYWRAARAVVELVIGDLDAYLLRALEMTDVAPNFVPGLRHLAVAYVLADRQEEAGSVVGQILQLAPHDRVSKTGIPFVNFEARTRYMESLRNAGLPE